MRALSLNKPNHGVIARRLRLRSSRDIYAVAGDLPVRECFDELRSALIDHGNAVLVAPPGSGTYPTTSTVSPCCRQGHCHRFRPHSALFVMQEKQLVYPCL